MRALMILTITAWAMMTAAGFSQQPSPRPGIASQNNDRDQQQQLQAAKPDERGTEQSPLVLKILQTPKSAVEAAKEKKAAEEVATNEERGLDINGRLATYTLWIAVVTSGIVVIAIWQAWITRTSAQSQLRAYVFVENVTLTDSSQIEEAIRNIGQIPPEQLNLPLLPPNVPHLQWIIKNSGQTPAYYVRHGGGVDVIEVRHEDALRPEAIDDHYPIAHIGAGGFTAKSAILRRPLSPQEITDIGIGNRAIYIYGRIEYLDAFKRKQSTDYRLKYNGKYPPIGPITAFSYCIRGNDAT